MAMSHAKIQLKLSNAICEQTWSLQTLLFYLKTWLILRFVYTSIW
jgi:hypothetical protein